MLISVTAEDNIGVAGVQFLWDGMPVGVEDTTSPYSVSVDTTTIVNGTYDLSARVRDAAGNIFTTAPIGIAVQNAVGQPPVPWACTGLMTSLAGIPTLLNLACTP